LYQTECYSILFIYCFFVYFFT